MTVSRVVRREGEELRREVLHRDVYAPRAEVVRVGTGTKASGRPADKPSDERDAEPDA